MTSSKLTPTVHISVMLEEVMEWVRPENGGTFVDGTFGGGGYTRALLERGADKVVAIDIDPLAIKRGAELQKEFGERLVLVNGQFSQIDEILKKQKMGEVNGIVLDLGFSSDQLDDSQRGLAFRHDGPLDMRLSSNLKTTAADVVNQEEEEELANIFYKYGEERKSRKIARKIVEVREEQPITTTKQLASLVEKVLPVWRNSGRHPAMRTFQALRIYVNRELQELEDILPKAAGLLKPQGRLCVVNFHSLEDRIVKNFFRQIGKRVSHHNKYKKDLHERVKETSASQTQKNTTATGRVKTLDLTGVDISANGKPQAKEFVEPFRKPLPATAEEATVNPRARSAKLRVLERV